MKKNINEYVKNILIVLSILTIVFVLIYTATKSILPDLLGTAVINTDTNNVEDEKLLYKNIPSFSLLNLSGDRVGSEDFANTPLVLVFWSTWNKVSADQIKIFDDYLLNNGNQSSLVKILAINNLEEIGVVKSFIKRGEYSVSVALDITGDVSNNYNIRSLPTTYFIDREGIVNEIYTGILNEEAIVDKVENLLK